ncbi:MAG: SGNH/GDSL hydrolase family protein [Chlorobi bacterium]|nr:SGNH/GDSL hydrolase family protein [Chlorobiota bacterium]
MKYRTIIFLSLVGLLFACKPEIDEFKASAGSADFSNYISVGNSLTAGYADGALYHSAQANSYPSILAQQFKTVGGGEFVQPVVESEYGVLPGKLVLDFSTNCLGDPSLGPVPASGQAEGYSPVGYSVNNLGVPGAKTFHLLAPGYGNPAGVPVGLANPYYARFASAADASVIGDAAAHEASFFSLWIGNNDVLGYATSGGIGDTITGQQPFAGYMNAILGTLTANGAKGVIANLPGITGAAFFNVIPYNGLVLTDTNQVNGLNAAYAPLGITFNLGQNPFIIADPNAPAGLRQITENEMVLLTTPGDSLRCAGWGSIKPIPDQYTLSETEIANINSAIEGYNATIKTLADTYNLAFVDINSYFGQVESGVTYDGESFSVTYVTGGTFSLDGIHLTQKGYALIANQFITAINGKYGANIPKVSVTDYPGIEFP